MTLDDFLKYLVWIVFFAIAVGGIYILLRKIGALG